MKIKVCAVFYCEEINELLVFPFSGEPESPTYQFNGFVLEYVGYL